LAIPDLQIKLVMRAFTWRLPSPQPTAASKIANATDEDTHVMKRNLMKSAAGVALLAALICSTPALARQHTNYHAKKKSCFWQAELVRPALTQPEKEAFIASCKADLAASPRGRQHGDY
jgi:hypothetical protein